jgi:hypothetical protein
MDRRRDVRVPTNDRARLSVPLRRFDPVEVQIMDVSRRGLRIACDAAFAPGTVIQLDMSGTVVEAQVCYSIRIEEQFQTGVQILRAVMKQ